MPGDQENFSFDKFMDDYMDEPDEYNPDAEYDEEEVDKPKKNIRNGRGLTKATHWDKANSQRNSALRNITSPLFDKMMRHPKIEALYTDKHLTNPHNTFDGDDYDIFLFPRLYIENQG